MIRKLLIANRGEIACRIARTCKHLGVHSVAVYSDADAEALHVQAADEALHIGAAAATESYLNIPAILAAATDSGADAVHPGYGFLAENADFAEAVIKAGLIFVGPAPEHIRAMGDKAEAKRQVAQANVPLVPGYDGASQDNAALQAAADAVGYPVLIKPSAGGGGKGMQVVREADALLDALAAARRTASSAFGNDHLMLERYVEKPRHIEVQVFGDGNGNAVHLFERECSLQRRYQKVVEEAPAVSLPETTRAAMAEAAIAVTRAIEYRGAGTVEFILAPSGEFFFIEMNTRLQVEHPVTEEITGQDLVEWQLRIASGEPLPLQQAQLSAKGHAIEVRICAEDPGNSFLPATGPLPCFEPALDARVETGVRSSDRVSPHYDSMIAKLIVHAADRPTAVRQLRRALDRTALLGLPSNLRLLRGITTHGSYLNETPDTGFIDRELELLLSPPAAPPLALAAVAVAAAQDITLSGDNSPWGQADAWEIGGLGEHRLRYRVGDEELTVRLQQAGARWTVQFDDSALILSLQTVEDGSLLLHDEHASHHARIWQAGGEAQICIEELGSWTFQQAALFPQSDAQTADDSQFAARIPGKVVSLPVAVGDRVTEGQTLLVLEAMKMEYTIAAPAAGRIDALHCAEGDQVEAEVPLLEFSANE